MTIEARSEAERQLDAKDEYAEAHGYPTFQDEPSAFLVGFEAGAEWQAAQQTSGDEQARNDMLLAVMEGIERWGDLLPTPEISGYVTDYLIREGFGRMSAAQQAKVWPPDGWFVFGSHVACPWIDLEFSDERDDSGDPKWERPIQQPGGWSS